MLLYEKKKDKQTILKQTIFQTIDKLLVLDILQNPNSEKLLSTLIGDFLKLMARTFIDKKKKNSNQKYVGILQFLLFGKNQ
jgi:hypothetical protein